MPKEKSKHKTSRNWVATHWDPEMLRNAERPPEVSFWAYQLELSPTTQRLHCHVYFVTANPLRLKGAMKLIPHETAMNCEPRRGTHEQCMAYVHKDETHVPAPEGFRVVDGRRTCTT